MAYLHRIRSPGTWNPTLVPSCPVELDTTHPLAQGLVSLFLPGISMSDLCGRAKPLVCGASGKTVVGPFGAALYQSDYLQTPTPSSLLTSSAVSMFAAGTITSNPTYYPRLVGICYTNNGNTAPYDVAGVQFTSSLAVNYLVWNSGGVAHNAVGSINFSLNTPTVAMVTYSVGGAINLYAGSSLSVTASFGASQPTYAANSVLEIFSNTSSPYLTSNLPSAAAIAAWWARQLSGAEAAWLAAEPFGMLRPIVRRQYYQTLSGSAWNAIFMAPGLSGSSNLGKAARSGLVLSTDVDAALAVAKVARAASVQAADIDTISAAARAGRGGKANSADVGAQTAAAKAGRAGVALSGGSSASPALGRVARAAKAIGAGISALYAAASKASLGGHPAGVLFSSLSVFGVAAKATRSSIAEILAISTTSAAGKSARVGKSQSVDVSSASAIGASRSDNTQAQAQVWIM